MEENGNTPKKVKIIINYNLYDFNLLLKGCILLEKMKFIKILKIRKKIKKKIKCFIMVDI